MKIVVWGTGKKERIIEQFILDTVEIAAFVDNNAQNADFCICMMRNGRYMEIPLLSPNDLDQLEYDRIIIASAAYKEIRRQCTDELNIPEEKVLQAVELNAGNYEQMKEIFDPNLFSDRNNYYIGGRRILLDEDHALPQMQKELPMYDRFAPYLAKLTQAKEGNYIIDIGANIGDTVFAMWDHTKDKFICVEPTDLFYDLGEKNIQGLKDAERVLFKKAFITDEVNIRYTSNVYIGGTAVKEKRDGYKADQGEGAPSVSLDGLLNETGIGFQEVDLIKIDTDGFDADCIISGEKALAEGTSLLYWENEIFTYEQYEKYQKAYDLLEKTGYETFFIFDNCGNFLCKADIDVLRSISAYQQRINMDWDRVTFDYTDVLACKNGDAERCRHIVDEYLGQYLLNRKRNIRERKYAGTEN